MTGTLSAIWQGSVRHRRHGTACPRLLYNLFMLGLDLDELLNSIAALVRGVERAGRCSRFRRDDALRGSE